jgi:outer membrane lipoprotein
MGTWAKKNDYVPCWKNYTNLMVGLGMLLATACTPVISPQLMNQVDRNLTYRELAEEADAFKGKMVLLGGTIVQAVPKPNQTEIEVVQKQLSLAGEPYLTDRSEGRFLIVVDRFLDPAIYRSGRDITVAGEVQDSVLRRLGEIDYRYPVVSGLEIYLWREPSYPRSYPYGYAYPYWWWHYPVYPY